jgi:Ca2+-binding EF-hand superfamily protein
MTLADVDGNGTISLDEFKDFINKLEDGQAEVSTDEGLKTIFDSLDENEDGEIDVEEFG